MKLICLASMPIGFAISGYLFGGMSVQEWFDSWFYSSFGFCLYWHFDLKGIIND